MQRKEISDYLKEISLYDLEGEITSAIKYLQEWHSYYKSRGYSSIILQAESETEGDYFQMSGTRLETDIEYKIRLEKSAKAKISKQKSKEKKGTCGT
jgi:hypothetical protein